MVLAVKRRLPAIANAANLQKAMTSRDLGFLLEVYTDACWGERDVDSRLVKKLCQRIVIVVGSILRVLMEQNDHQSMLRLVRRIEGNEAVKTVCMASPEFRAARASILAAQATEAKAWDLSSPESTSRSESPTHYATATIRPSPNGGRGSQQMGLGQESRGRPPLRRTSRDLEFDVLAAAAATTASSGLDYDGADGLGDLSRAYATLPGGNFSKKALEGRSALARQITEELGRAEAILNQTKFREVLDEADEEPRWGQVDYLNSVPSRPSERRSPSPDLNDSKAAVNKIRERAHLIQVALEEAREGRQATEMDEPADKANEAENVKASPRSQHYALEEELYQARRKTEEVTKLLHEERRRAELRIKHLLGDFQCQLQEAHASKADAELRLAKAEEQCSKLRQENEASMAKLQSQFNEKVSELLSSREALRWEILQLKGQLDEGSAASGGAAGVAASKGPPQTYLSQKEALEGGGHAEGSTT
mmetsp:Transcript_57756/g.122862  ORF Transcript_57756/g.122862 Transcript_57756/m.122862 type:complete len:481 (+) Transcript_57756:45-1487(+)